MNITMYELHNDNLNNKNMIKEFFDERYKISLDWDEENLMFVVLIDEYKNIIGVSIIRQDTSNQRAHIAAMCVDNIWQRKTLGTKMLHYIIQKFNHYTVTLAVTFQEIHLLPLYSKFATITHTDNENGIFVLLLNKKQN